MKSKTMFIHVNRNTLAANKKRGERNPPVTVRTRSRVLGYGQECVIAGASRVVYNEEKPLSCGARVWIETEAPVFLDGEEVKP